MLTENKPCMNCEAPILQSGNYGRKRCADCSKIHTREYRTRWAKKNYKRNRKLLIERSAKYGREHKTARSHYHRFLVWGLTQESYDKMLKKQSNCCAVCKEIFTKTPHIDHDHKTNKIRGLLCSNCNLMLGHAKDSVVRLKNGVLYLESYAS